MSFVPETKHASPYTGQTKNAGVYTIYPHPGAPWTYNQAGFTYNISLSPDSEGVVYYNANGRADTFVAELKS